MLYGKQTIVTLIALVLATVLMACSNADGTSLEDTRWVLTSLNGNSLLEDTRITLNFSKDHIEGLAGCNTYGCKYGADRGILVISEIERTVVKCTVPDGIMEQERCYLDSLKDMTSYRINDTQLRLEADDGSTLVFTVQE